MALVDAGIYQGQSLGSKAQGRAYLKRRNAEVAKAKRIDPLSTAELDEIVDAYWDTSVYPIAPDGALAQGIVETAAWTFGNQVPASAHNPAGIGAINDGRSYLTFDSWARGIAVQKAHLLAWCNKPGGAGSPRYAIVKEVAKTVGYARTWRDLGGRWAVPGLTYGDSIETHWQGILREKVTTMPNIIDVRDQLPRGGKGGQRNSPGFMGFPAKVGPKQGAIVHYSGDAVDLRLDTMAILKSYASWHIQNTPEWGIAYHFDVDEDGIIRQLRDRDDVLWHCAAWPYNATWYSIHLMMGEGQRATAKQLSSAVALLAYLAADDDYPITNIKGHKEVSQTACPGTLMADLVLPVRAGKLVEAVKASVVEIAPPVGFLAMGTPDVFDWQGEGVVVHRETRFYNPYKNTYYERSWDNATGYTPWVEVK